ncbi:hypothetical protein [Novosphingobium clariflavum]|uniref:Sugar transporter n=1 Tax=Novosphingobium clariflavum TaxID=2029884 RepID=A0ABV6SDX6_9SPHN|nr:hypothetical protein [Novosphingobium clariflavum]
MTRTAAARAPVHLWLVGVLAIAWNGFGCLDYAMTVTRDPAWMAPVPPAVVDWLDAAPVWALAGWAFGVGGGLLGALLLVMRSRWAVHAFALSLLGLAANQAYLLLSPIPAAATLGDLALRLAIWTAALVQFFYTARLRGRGALT